MKAGRSRASRSKRRKEGATEQEREPPRTRQDMVLLWEAKRGSSTALVGLGRGGEALAEAEEAVELADQVRGTRALSSMRKSSPSFKHVHACLPLYTDD